MTILLTGGTGFVGSYLLRLLVQKGYTVRALRRADSPMDLVRDFETRAEWVEADLTDLVALEAAFDGVTHVCHCAAMVSFNARDARRMMQINVEGTANIVNLSLESGVRKLVHVSSIAALGRSKERPNLSEKSGWVQSSGNSNYAVSKYLSEQEVWRGRAEGLSVAIANPAVVIGSGFWNQGTARFFGQIDRGLPFWPTGRSGFVDVRDVANFLALLLESDLDGERYILNAQNTPYRDFFGMIAAALEVRPPFIRVGSGLAEIAWRVEWLKEKLLGLDPVVTKESARSSVSQYEYDNAKSRTVPGFVYRPLEQTIRETAAQYTASKRLGLRAMMLPTT
jgi:dihydroflavonol-4-reductase